MTLDLPSELADRLTDLRTAFKQAMGTDRQAHARDDLAQLIVALHAAGWSYAAIARSQTLTTQAISVFAAKARAAGVSGAGVSVPTPLNNDWLSRAHAARLAGVHPYTLTDWQQQGLLPSTRVRGHATTLFSRADLEHVMAMRGGRSRLPDNTR